MITVITWFLGILGSFITISTSFGFWYWRRTIKKRDEKERLLEIKNDLIEKRKDDHNISMQQKLEELAIQQYKANEKQEDANRKQEHLTQVIEHILIDNKEIHKIHSESMSDYRETQTMIFESINLTEEHIDETNNIKKAVIDIQQILKSKGESVRPELIMKFIKIPRSVNMPSNVNVA